MREAFETWNPNAASLATVAAANNIIRAYQAQGYSLTLRQLYYQFVARGLMENKQQNYKNLGALLSRARLAGLVDWSAIEDRTRNLAGGSHGWGSPSRFIESVMPQFRIDIWEDQPAYVEVWVEKEALAGVVERPCGALRVAYFCCRGNVSQSEMYEAGKRFLRQSRDGKDCHLFHLGDHDPNGIDMTRDNRDRLTMFSEQGVTLHRIALTMAQIEELSPPPNPAKETDSRYGGYVSEFGTTSSWELDALDPAYIDNLVRDHIEELIDRDLMDEREREEEQGREELEKIATHYPAVKAYLETLE